jgi:hypothetical protein
MRGPFIAPKRNLPVGVSENRTCPVSGAEHVWNPSLNPSMALDMSGVWAKPGLGLRSRTCPLPGPNMSGFV